MHGVVGSQLAKARLMFVLILLLLISTTVSAETAWFDRHSEGWFWYETIQEPEPLADKELEHSQPSPTKELPLSTPWIRKNIGHYLDKAIDEPSKKNVSNYLYLDRLVKEKAERFARVGKQVIESDPMLDENVRRPISPAAAKINDNRAHQAKEEILRKIAKKAGLVFYYRGNCKLCHLQAQAVRMMKEIYGFELITFSTDGEFIPSFPDSHIERTPHPRLNIQAYPALYLMQPPGKIVLLRQGVMSFAGLTERILDIAFEQEWITHDDFKGTRINHESWSHSISIQRSPAVSNAPNFLHTK